MLAILIAATVATATIEPDPTCDFVHQISNGREIARISPDKTIITVTTETNDGRQPNRSFEVFRVGKQALQVQSYTVPVGSPSATRSPLVVAEESMVLNNKDYSWYCPSNSRPVDTLTAPR